MNYSNQWIKVKATLLFVELLVKLEASDIRAVAEISANQSNGTAFLQWLLTASVKPFRGLLQDEL